MTPRRKAYFEKCSDKEKTIRLLIKSTKREIKKRKEFLNGGYDDGDDESDYHYFKIAINKVALQALRHELQRLKGMDRVVVPYELMRFGFKANVPRVSYNCECFEPIYRKYKYCPKCGRRIMWRR
jgi:hypothetical protein